MHGNEPSKGAKIDAEIQREEEEELKRKGKAQTNEETRTGQKAWVLPLCQGTMNLVNILEELNRHLYHWKLWLQQRTFDHFPGL